jgi:exopolysaccharide biosynthesis predicted pyruvyltransferase EpsI
VQNVDIDGLQRASMAGLDHIAGGVDQLAWIDFPDYSNVGDSAIWLGQLAWAKARGVEQAAAVPARAVTLKVLRALKSRNVLPVINGGGNFGGLYGGHQQTRMRTLQASADSRVAQAPQSVHFVNGAQADLVAAIMQVADFRMAVRDQPSKSMLHGIVDAKLAPDSVHLLGWLPSPPPSKKVVVLAREDREQAGDAGNVNGALDWLAEPSFHRRLRQFRAEISGRLGSISPLPSLAHYERVARERLARGMAILAQGEVVVTDRLHAMLIALQMGKTVVVVDNGVKKLTRYADAWLPHNASGAVIWARDLPEALRVAG